MRNGLTRTIVLFTLVFTTAAFAGAARPATLKTRDGRVLTGKVLSEGTKGYLFRTDQKTELIEYGNVDDLSYESDAVVPPPPPPSSPATSMPPPPPPSYYPPADTNSETPVVERHVTDWVEDRRGLKFGIGVSPYVFPEGIFDYYNLPVSLGVGGQFVINFGLGRADIRLSPGVAFWYSTMSTLSVSTLQFGLEASARFNIARVFAMGVGTYQGLAFGFLSGCYGSLCANASGASLFISPMLYPAIFKLGESGNHQLSLALLFPARLTPNPEISPYPYFVVNYSVMF